MISLDTETSGTDFYHGARPFYTTICCENGDQKWWDWRVDPITRKPEVPIEDLIEIRDEVYQADAICGHNLRFDVKALGCAFADAKIEFRWDWLKTHDSLIAGHLLASNQPHNLTDMVMHYLGYDIEPLEKALEAAVNQARRYCRSHLKNWAIAKKDRPNMPSAKEKTWRYDYWLPALLAEKLGYPEWITVLRDYSNADSAVSLALWKVLEQELHARGLWAIYQNRMKLLPVASELERRGVTVNQRRIEELLTKFQDKLDDSEAQCILLAKQEYGYDLNMPKGSTNQSLTEFVFNVLKLPVVKRTDSGAPSFDSKIAVPHYLEKLDPGSNAHLFVKNIAKARKRHTSINFLQNYLHFGLPTGNPGRWLHLHTSANPTGTDTLRWSFKTPNASNISKLEITCMDCRGEGCPECDHTGIESFNLRYCFGPAAGREWWSFDYENLELRIPAYEADERALIDLLERPKDPPFYGSIHLLGASIIYPELFEPLADQKGEFKRRYGATYYQWIKNCVPMDTRALTRDGWKGYSEIQVGDEVLGYDNGVLRWTPVLDKVFHKNAYTVEMSNEHFKCVSTRTHRWSGRKRVCGTDHKRRYVESEFMTMEIGAEHEIYLSAPTVDESRLNISDDEAALIGFVYGDGHVEKSRKSYGPARGIDGKKVGFIVSIYRSKTNGIDYLERLLVRWGGGYTKKQHKGRAGYIYYLRSPACRDLWKRAGLWDGQDFERFVLDLGSSQRSAYLEGVWQAEGSLDKNGYRLYTQCNQSLGASRGKIEDWKWSFLESIRLAIYMTGHFPTSHEKSETELTRNKCFGLRESNPKVTGQRLKKKSAGVQDVWCIRTGLGTWVMRQGDQIMITGNSMFAVLYGCMAKKFDETCRRSGGYLRVREKLINLFKLSDKWIGFAHKHGYVETVPNRGVDPKRGYPIMVTRTEYGKVLPTVPLNYHVQSTAMDCTNSAMIRWDVKLREWQREGFDAFQTLQVHDENVADMPRGDNWARAMELKRLMEKSGDDIGIPLPVSCKLHRGPWSEDSPVE